jgi:hypothetical protein
MSAANHSPGVCVHCGCTNDRACSGGCAWYNAERTVCTACAYRDRDELLFHDLAVELSRHKELIELKFDAVVLYALVGQLLIALRHPLNNNEAAEISRRFIEQLRQDYFHAPAICETIRRGFDAPRESAVIELERPSLILPDQF